MSHLFRHSGKRYAACEHCVITAITRALNKGQLHSAESQKLADTMPI